MVRKLFVRVQPKSGQKMFFRCGTQFSQAWQEVEVDNATAKRLEEEQMLEVSEKQPMDYEEQVPNAADPAGNKPLAAVVSGAPAAAPEDPAERYAAIKTAIANLDKADATAWTKGGSPKTEAIEAITGWPVTAAERDAATAEGGAQ